LLSNQFGDIRLDYSIKPSSRISDFIENSIEDKEIYATTDWLLTQRTHGGSFCVEIDIVGP
jgi:hypothetical protein